MGTIFLVIIWAGMIFQGIYGIVKGHFYREPDKVNKHDPKAYRKWVRFCSVLMALCGIVNVALSILERFTDPQDFKYTIIAVIAVVVVIAAAAISYRIIVKPADKAMGIESEFDKIAKEKQQ